MCRFTDAILEIIMETFKNYPHSTNELQITTEQVIEMINIIWRKSICRAIIDKWTEILKHIKFDINGVNSEGVHLIRFYYYDVETQIKIVLENFSTDGKTFKYYMNYRERDVLPDDIFPENIINEFAKGIKNIKELYNVVYPSNIITNAIYDPHPSTIPQTNKSTKIPQHATDTQEVVIAITANECHAVPLLQDNT
jgi:hypothetical protein